MAQFQLGQQVRLVKVDLQTPEARAYWEPFIGSVGTVEAIDGDLFEVAFDSANLFPARADEIALA